MSAFKEIQKGNFTTWTDEHGKILFYIQITYYIIREKNNKGG